MLALILAVLVALSGTSLTYLYDRTSPLLVRLAIGICSGFAWFATVGFALSCVIGLNAVSISLALATLLVPVVLTRKLWLEALRRDLVALQNRDRVLDNRKNRWISNACFSLLLMVVSWAMSHVSYQKNDGLYTAYETNIGDLTLHFQIMTGFAWGGNFPPQNPIYAGSLIVYPFLPDFLTAIWLRCGASFPFAVELQTEMLAFALVVLLQRLSLELVRDRLAATIAPWLVIFSGGWGWLLFIRNASDSPTGFRALLSNLPVQYSNTTDTWRWCNTLTTLFVTQRSLLLGLPLALTVLLLWWRFLSGRNGAGAITNLENLENPQVENALFHPLLAAGFFASMLPLMHSHTFLVVGLTSVYIAFLIRPRHFAQRDWRLFYFALAPIVFVELLYFVVARRSQGEMTPGAFFAWNFGWDKANAEFLTFWLKNTGAFWPLLFFALWQKKDSRAALKRFALWLAPLFLLYLVALFNSVPFQAWPLRVLVVLFFAAVPVLIARLWPPNESEYADENWRRAVVLLSVFITVGFVMPNLFRFAPWVWDNNKILIYWFMVASPFAALGLAHLWRARCWRRGLAVFLFWTMTFAGALDIWHGANGQLEQRNFDNDGMALAQTMRALPRGTIVLHAPTFNSPVCLSGKNSVMGYPGHLTSYGFNCGPRELEVQSFFRGDAGSERVLEKYGATVFILGPQEREYMAHLNQPMAPPEYWNKWKKVAQNGEYTLFTTR